MPALVFPPPGSPYAKRWDTTRFNGFDLAPVTSTNIRNLLLDSSNLYGNSWAVGSYVRKYNAINDYLYDLEPFQSNVVLSSSNDQTVITSSNVNQRISQRLNVLPNTTYTFSFYAKRGTSSDAIYRIQDLTNNVSLATGSYYGQINSSGLTRVVVTFTTRANTVRLDVYPLWDIAGTPGTNYISDLQFELGSSATAYQKTYGTVNSADGIIVQRGVGLILPRTNIRQPVAVSTSTGQVKSRATLRNVQPQWPQPKLTSVNRLKATPSERYINTVAKAQASAKMRADTASLSISNIERMKLTDAFREPATSVNIFYRLDTFDNVGLTEGNSYNVTGIDSGVKSNTTQWYQYDLDILTTANTPVSYLKIYFDNPIPTIEFYVNTYVTVADGNDKFTFKVLDAEFNSVTVAKPDSWYPSWMFSTITSASVSVFPKYQVQPKGKPVTPRERLYYSELLPNYNTDKVRLDTAVDVLSNITSGNISPQSLKLVADGAHIDTSSLQKTLAVLTTFGRTFDVPNLRSTTVLRADSSYPIVSTPSSYTTVIYDPDVSIVGRTNDNNNVLTDWYVYDQDVYGIQPAPTVETQPIIDLSSNNAALGTDLASGSQGVIDLYNLTSDPTVNDMLSNEAVFDGDLSSGSGFVELSTNTPFNATITLYFEKPQIGTYTTVFVSDTDSFGYTYSKNFDIISHTTFSVTFLDPGDFPNVSRMTAKLGYSKVYSTASFSYTNTAPVLSKFLISSDTTSVFDTPLSSELANITALRDTTVITVPASLEERILALRSADTLLQVGKTNVMTVLRSDLAYFDVDVLQKQIARLVSMPVNTLDTSDDIPIINKFSVSADATEVFYTPVSDSLVKQLIKLAGDSVASIQSNSLEERLLTLAADGNSISLATLRNVTDLQADGTDLRAKSFVNKFATSAQADYIDYPVDVSKLVAPIVVRGPTVPYSVPKLSAMINVRADTVIRSSSDYITKYRIRSDQVFFDPPAVTGKLNTITALRADSTIRTSDSVVLKAMALLREAGFVTQVLGLSEKQNTRFASVDSILNSSSISEFYQQSNVRTVTPPINPREVLFYATVAPGYRYNLSIEQGVQFQPDYNSFGTHSLEKFDNVGLTQGPVYQITGQNTGSSANTVLEYQFDLDILTTVTSPISVLTVYFNNDSKFITSFPVGSYVSISRTYISTTGTPDTTIVSQVLDSSVNTVTIALPADWDTSWDLTTISSASVDVFPRIKVFTNVAPVNARENLFYAEIAPGLRSRNNIYLATDSSDTSLQSSQFLAPDYLKLREADNILAVPTGSLKVASVVKGLRTADSVIGSIKPRSNIAGLPQNIPTYSIGDLLKVNWGKNPDFGTRFHVVFVNDSRGAVIRFKTGKFNKLHDIAVKKKEPIQFWN